MLVADLSHFLDLPDDVPGPARRLAEQLGRIVQVSTAGAAGARWTSALACGRRPGNRPCAGRIVVQRPEAPAAVHWWCSVCDDEGTISNWEGSPYDLRRRGLAVVQDASHVVVTDDVAEANHESDRRRQSRLDAAFDVLSAAANRTRG